MTKISKINAREILDSRGNPTIEVEVFLGNHYGRALVPSGASIGSREVIELRDQDQKRFFGKGVLQAVDNVRNKISEILIGLEVTQQEKIDQLMIELDGTKNKSNLGANAILGTSLAVAKAAASSLNLPLYEYLAKDNKGQIPTPMVNIINGGLHANNNLDIQEFMIIPKKETSFREMIRSSAEVFHSLKKILTDNGHSTNVGDEGGFAPNLSSIEVALDYIMQAIDRAGYSKNFSIALDSAASTFYQDGNYLIAEKKLNYEELTEYYSQLCTQYPIISLEDPLAEDDFIGWKHITNVLGGKVQLVGDDLFVTNPEIFLQGIENNLANAILIKPNQIGTLTETLRTIEIARKYNYKSIISHRSGETEDTTIAHIGVGVCLEYIKTGSLSRSERVAKYNELLRIEENL